MIRSGGLGYRGSWRLGKTVSISLGGRGGVTVQILPKGRLSLSSNQPDKLEAAILELSRRERR